MLKCACMRPCRRSDPSAIQFRRIQMKKRVLSLLLVLLLSVCALSACGEEEPPTPPPSNETDSDLAFTLKEDGTYAVSAGKLIAEETIEIPAEYNGKSVTEIEERGFQGASAKKIGRAHV